MTDKTTYTSVGSLRNSGWRSEAEDSLIRSGQVVIGFAGAGGNDSQADTGLIPGIFSTHAIEINPELSTSVTEVSRSTGNHDGFDRFCRARDAGSVSAADWIEQIKRIWAHGPASTLVLARAVAAAKDPVLRLTVRPSMKSWSVIGCCLSTVLPAIPVTTDRWSEGCGKAALDQQRMQALVKDVPMALEVELATHKLNHRRLRSLSGLTPCQVYHDPQRRLRIHGAVRDQIFREIFEQFWQFAQCMPERNRHSLNAGWRLIVEDWLRRQRWITVRQNNQQNVSTNSKGFFSQN